MIDSYKEIKIVDFSELNTNLIHNWINEACRTMSAQPTESNLLFVNKMLRNYLIFQRQTHPTLKNNYSLNDST